MRIVFKVGSHVLTEHGSIAKERMLALVALLHDVRQAGNEVILVSSGAVAAGHTKLPIERSDVADKQALAAIGQPLLMKMYQEKFERYGILCSQILLGADVFDSRRATAHAKDAIDRLLLYGVVPIINENDTVSVDELIFGDNDRLSAHVTHYFDAQMLVILSDIDAYYDKDPRRNDDAKVQKTVRRIDPEALDAECTPHDSFATGGIVTKLQAADFLMRHGRKMFLASGFDLSDVRAFLLQGDHRGGTLFSAS